MLALPGASRLWNMLGGAIPVTPSVPASAGSFPTSGIIAGYPQPTRPLFSVDEVLQQVWPQPWYGSGDLDPIDGGSPENRACYLALYKKEPRLNAAIEGKVASISSLKVSMRGADEDNPEDVEAANFIDATIRLSKHGSWVSLLASILRPGLVYGWSAGEITLDEITTGRYRGRWGLKHVRNLNTEPFVKLQLDVFRNITGVVNLIRGIQDYDPKKFVFYVNKPIFSNPFGQSDVQPAQRAALLFREVYQVWYVALKQFGLPYMHGKVKNPNYRKALENALDAIRGGGWAVTTEEDSIEVLNLASAASANGFESMIDKLSEDIFFAVRGSSTPSAVSSNKGGDNRGDTKESRKSGQDPIEKLAAEDLVHCINQWLIPRLMEPNFPPSVGMPYLTIGDADDTDTEKRLKTIAIVENELKRPTSTEEIFKLSGTKPADPSNPEDAKVIQRLQAESQQAAETPGGGMPGTHGGDDAPPPGGGGGGPKPPAPLPPGGGNAKQLLPGAKPAPQQSIPAPSAASPATSQPAGGAVPPELVVAMLEAAAEKDWQAVDSLTELGNDPEGLAELLGDREAGTYGAMSTRAFSALNERMRTFSALAGRRLASPTIAGLAVRAADTGRVLMLRRKETPGDAASNHWEFPGGHLKRGEHPEVGAKREWIEETGQRLPNGKLVGSWHHPNGIYTGYVWEIPDEDAISLDAEGDQGEPLKWWSPASLTGNPEVRAEVVELMPNILPLLNGLRTFAAWSEDDHPRAADGKFGRGDAYANGNNSETSESMGHKFEKADVSDVIALAKKNTEMRLARPEETPEEAAARGLWKDRNERNIRRQHEKNGYYLVDLPVDLLNISERDVDPARMKRLEELGGSDDPIFVGIDEDTGKNSYNIDDGNNRAQHAKNTGKKTIKAYVTPHSGSLDVLAKDLGKQFSAVAYDSPRRFSAFRGFASWFHDPSPRSKSRITNSETGAHAYGDTARRIMESQGREERGEPHPETPKQALIRMKAEREPAREVARAAYQKALNDPGSLTGKDLEGLRDHLHTLTRDEIRQNLRQVMFKAGGKLKADLVDGLLEHVRGNAIAHHESKLDPLGMGLDQDIAAKAIQDLQGKSLPRKSARDQEAEAEHLAKNDHNKRRQERGDLMRNVEGDSKTSHGTPDLGSKLKQPDKMLDVRTLAPENREGLTLDQQVKKPEASQEGAKSAPTPTTPNDDAELAALNRTPYKELTPEQKARRDQLSQEWNARKNPDATPFMTGGGKGPGVSDSENESTQDTPFTGIDAQGREWKNGELVGSEKKPASLESISARLDSLLGKGGEIDKANEELKQAKTNAQFHLHVHRVGDKFGVFYNPTAGRTTDQHLVSTFPTKEAAEDGWRAKYREMIEPHKAKVRELESEMERLREQEGEMLSNPPTQSDAVQGKEDAAGEKYNQSPNDDESKPVYTSPDAEHVADIARAREADKKFRGEGRYEAEVWQKLRNSNPDKPMPPLSRDAAEWLADGYERDGKPIPDEVLKDHPDLHAQYKHTPTGSAQPVPSDSQPATAAHTQAPTYTTDKPQGDASVMSEAASKWLDSQGGDLSKVDHDAISAAARSGALPRKAELELRRAKLAAEEAEVESVTTTPAKPDENAQVTDAGGNPATLKQPSQESPNNAPAGGRPDPTILRESHLPGRAGAMYTGGAGGLDKFAEQAGLPSDFYEDHRVTHATKNGAEISGIVAINPKYDPDGKVEAAIDKRDDARRRGLYEGQRKKFYDQQVADAWRSVTLPLNSGHSGEETPDITGGGSGHKTAPSITPEQAEARKWKKNGDGTYTAPNGVVWKKAAAGGEVSPVTGEMFKGGSLMPIHGKSQGGLETDGVGGEGGARVGAGGKADQKKKRAAQPSRGRQSRDIHGNLVPVPENHQTLESIVGGSPMKSHMLSDETLANTLGITRKQANDLKAIYESGAVSIPREALPPSSHTHGHVPSDDWDIPAKLRELNATDAAESTPTASPSIPTDHTAALSAAKAHHNRRTDTERERADKVPTPRSRFSFHKTEQDHFSQPSEPGYVYRVQPKGVKLHGQQSETSNGEKIPGVFVFDDLGQLAAIDWANTDNVELVKIKASDSDTFQTHDQEGMGLKKGKGKVVARLPFDSTDDVQAWASERQSQNWDTSDPWQKPERYVSKTDESTENKERWQLTKKQYAEEYYNGGDGLNHYRAVDAALAAGNPVPPEVLADYPDLASKYAPAGSAPPVSPQSAPAAVEQQTPTPAAAKPAAPFMSDSPTVARGNAESQIDKELAKNPEGWKTVADWMESLAAKPDSKLGKFKNKTVVEWGNGQYMPVPSETAAKYFQHIKDGGEKRSETKKRQQEQQQQESSDRVDREIAAREESERQSMQRVAKKTLAQYMSQVEKDIVDSGLTGAAAQKWRDEAKDYHARSVAASQTIQPAASGSAPAIPSDVAKELAARRTHERRMGKPVGEQVAYRQPDGKVVAVPSDSYMGKELLAGKYPHFKIEGRYTFDDKGKPVMVKAVPVGSASDWDSLRAELIQDDAPPG